MFVIFTRDKRTAEERRTDELVADFERRRKAKRQKEQPVPMPMTRTQRKFAKQWAKQNRTPQERAHDEWLRAENWKTAALSLLWLLVVVWLLS